MTKSSLILPVKCLGLPPVSIGLYPHSIALVQHPLRSTCKLLYGYVRKIPAPGSWQGSRGSFDVVLTRFESVTKGSLLVDIISMACINCDFFNVLRAKIAFELPVRKRHGLLSRYRPISWSPRRELSNRSRKYVINCWLPGVFRFSSGILVNCT